MPLPEMYSYQDREALTPPCDYCHRRACQCDYLDMIDAINTDRKQQEDQ